MYANRNAKIRSRRRNNGNVVTETVNRDDNFDVSVTKTSSGATKLSVKTENGLVVRLNGHNARTLFRALAKHYYLTSSSLTPVVEGPFGIIVEGA